MIKDKKKIIMGLVGIVTLMTIGYAAFSTKLNIKGTSSISSNWDIHISNIETKETHGNASDGKAPTWDKLTASISTNLESPGDYKIYTITIVNNGDIDATLKKIESTNTNNSAITFNIIGFNEGDDLLAGKSATMDIKIMYNSNVTSQPSNLESTLKLNLIFEQKTTSKIINTSNIYTFNYTGDEQVFTVPQTGNYKIEVWGAQGGSVNDEYLGGYGSYSIGTIKLNKNDKLYINIGGQGTSSNGESKGGYNGGGTSLSSTSNTSTLSGSGGGATSIATSSGIIKSFSNNKSNIIIISSGGGGSIYSTQYNSYSNGGNGGGITGCLPNKHSSDRKHQSIGEAATQSEGGKFGLNYNNSYSSAVEVPMSNGSFGQGGTYANSTFDTWVAGGGAGFYGGAGSYLIGGGGGSSYIGNANLTNKHMACYECQISNEESTKTISVTTSSNMPISDSAKEGNGYARITYLN